MLKKAGGNKSSESKIIIKESKVFVKLEVADADNESKTCRVCLKEGIIQIYGESSDIKLSEDLSYFGGIVVSKDDAYPKYLCQACHTFLYGAVLFRKTAQESDVLLRKSAKQKSSNDLNDEGVEEEESDNDIDDDKDNSSLDFEYEIKIVKCEEKDTDKINRCDRCNLNFKTSKEYATHRRTDEHKKQNNSKSTCSICNKLFHRSYIRQHYKLHEKEKAEETESKKKYHCNRCDLDFKTAKEHAEHRESDEHENQKTTCSICKGSYSHRYIKKHYLIHKNETSFICDVCGKKFIIKEPFIRHCLTHSYNNLQFKCSLCPYKGRFKESLKMHMRSHTGEKPYVCPHCPSRSFINKSNLSKHILRTHKGTRDHKCDRCPRGFYTKPELDLHFRAEHLGIKDFICMTCGNAFGARRQLLKHQLKVHKREKMRSGRMPVYLLAEKINKTAE